MQLTKYFLMAVLVLSAGRLRAQQNPVVLDYINTYKDLAEEEMQRTGVPAAIILAQGIHESQAGQSELVQKSNNHFGIKCKSTWTGDRVYHDDDRLAECFRSYPSAVDSYRDHSDFLRNNQRYAFLFSLDPTDYKEWAYGLKKAGYATNSRYPQILIDLIEKYDLEKYTLIAMGKIMPKEEITAEAPPPADSAATAVSAPVSKPSYPDGEFQINRTPVIYVPAGTSLLVVADKYAIPLKRLLDFNDLAAEDVLEKDQLLFLQRKRKLGARPYHKVLTGETLYDICQREGIRLESLLQLNHLASSGMQPAAGEQLYLQENAPQAPALASSAGVGQPTADNWSAGQGKYRLHLVKSGESLEDISRQYGVPVNRIMDWNSLADQALRPGQELKIYQQ